MGKLCGSIFESRRNWIVNRQKHIDKPIFTIACGRLNKAFTKNFGGKMAIISEIFMIPSIFQKYLWFFPGIFLIIKKLKHGMKL